MLMRLPVLAAMVLVSASSAFAAEGGCHVVSGTYVNQNVLCPVPALACVESTSTVSGGWGQDATALFIITGFDPVTQVFTGTGTSTLESGAVLTTTISGTLAKGSVQTLTGGTRQYAHTTGSIVSDGAGNFVAEYCFSNAG
ncbi:MAG: hypothetical protein ABWY12_12900 [Burkholderiales bacterium]